MHKVHKTPANILSQSRRHLPSRVPLYHLLARPDFPDLPELEILITRGGSYRTPIRTKRRA